MGALTRELREFLDRHPVGVLATRTAGDGPRQSVVYFARDGERCGATEPPEPMSDAALAEAAA